MKTDNQQYFYVGVQFRDNAMPYSYLCHNLSVKIGDEVLVPVYDNEKRNGIVVSTGFYSADNAPYPPEKTKTVICIIPPDEQEISDSSSGTQIDQPAHDNRENGKARTDMVANILTSIVFTPILTVVFGFGIAIILLALGWDTDDGVWLPFVLAFPAAVGFCIYAIKHPTPVQTKKSPKRHVGSGGSSGGGWYPGCPEEKMFSSTDNAFDFDGNGRLDSAESSTKFDIFFGDDE